MKITRRQILAGAAALPFAGLPAWVGATVTMGKTRIDTLSDGHLSLPRAFVLGDAPEPEADAILARHGITGAAIEPPCNLTLLRDGTNIVLFDTGAGATFQPTAGKLATAMDALEVSADEITHVIFTHGHPDHLWGLIDDFDEPVFANATHMMGAREFAYWRDPNTASTIGQQRQTFAAGAKRRLDMLGERFEMVTDGQEVVPGVAAMATFGHSPGHMAYEIRQGTDSVMVVGDALTNAHIAFERPGWHSGTDQDWEMGARTRVRLINRIAQEKMRLIGFHLPGAGIGRAEKQGDGYRFVAET